MHMEALNGPAWYRYLTNDAHVPVISIANGLFPLYDVLTNSVKSTLALK